VPAIKRHEPNKASEAGSGATESKDESNVPSTVVPCDPVRPRSEAAFDAVEEENEKVRVLLALVPLPSWAKFCSSVLLVQPVVEQELNDKLLSTRVSAKLP
jgi:hypothetical protein